MFTGLIETIGNIENISPRGDIWKCDILAPAIAGKLSEGDSVSVSGACCTVTNHDYKSFSVELMEETRRRTKFESLRNSSKVNLERALKLDSRIDGHLVSGHIDGMAVVSDIKNGISSKELHFTATPEITSGIVQKGSVTVDGVSLTVIDRGEDFFSVGIIPTTLSATTIGDLRIGDKVNIETDMIGKYILSFLKSRFSEDKDIVKNSITWDKLIEYGWG
ncbi:MAG: riboflavin synthase [Synergistaceae bacterium]|nr:riboflavin synthase [Synergistaceae bacterium]